MDELYDDLDEMDEVDELEEVDEIESEVDIDQLIEEELGNEGIEDDTYGVLRDVLDQNVEQQHLPSESKFDILEGEDRNATYRLKDDASIQINGETITGEEFNERLMEEYGMDSVIYTNGEADFSNYVSSIHKSDIQALVDDEVDKEFEGHGYLERSVDSIERRGENGTIDEAHEIIARELECDVEDVKSYLKENHLVIHEEGIDGFEVVPYEIHNTFDHTGSIGIKKDFNALCESIQDTLDSDSFVLVRDENVGEVSNLEEAIQATIDKNKQIKSELYSK